MPRPAGGSSIADRRRRSEPSSALPARRVRAATMVVSIACSGSAFSRGARFSRASRPCSLPAAERTRLAQRHPPMLGRSLRVATLLRRLVAPTPRSAPTRASARAPYASRPESCRWAATVPSTHPARMIASVVPCVPQPPSRIPIPMQPFLMPCAELIAPSTTIVLRLDLGARVARSSQPTAVRACA
jgi:hypothetical protein